MRDTRPEIERMMTETYRRMSSAEKLRRASRKRRIVVVTAYAVAT